MKVIASLLSISLTAITMLPAAAADTSDRASWIQATLAGNHTATTKKTSTSKSTSVTASSSASLARSVADIYGAVKIRPFVANRYLPSEHDIEAAQAQQVQQAQTAMQTQLPASTVQLAKAMATTQAMNVQQHQLQGNVAYTGGYYNNNMSSAPVRPRATSLQSRLNSLNALAPSIPQPPVSGNETIEQIRSSMRSNGGQTIASANTSLYPDIVGPVPTMATAGASKAAPSPLSFLSQRSTRQYSNAGARTAATGNSMTQGSLGGWRTNTPQAKPANLSYAGFQSYTRKTGSLPAADYNIASADCYSTSTSHYTPYVSSQSSTLPY